MKLVLNPIRLCLLIDFLEVAHHVLGYFVLAVVTTNLGFLMRFNIPKYLFLQVQIKSNSFVPEQLQVFGCHNDVGGFVIVGKH